MHALKAALIALIQATNEPRVIEALADDAMRRCDPDDLEYQDALAALRRYRGEQA